MISSIIRLSLHVDQTTANEISGRTEVDCNAHSASLSIYIIYVQKSKTKPLDCCMFCEIISCIVQHKDCVLLCLNDWCFCVNWFIQDLVNRQWLNDNKGCLYLNIRHPAAHVDICDMVVSLAHRLRQYSVIWSTLIRFPLHCSSKIPNTQVGTCVLHVPTCTRSAHSQTRECTMCIIFVKTVVELHIWLSYVTLTLWTPNTLVLWLTWVLPYMSVKHQLYAGQFWCP